jgi:hypothetical protein
VSSGIHFTGTAKYARILGRDFDLIMRMASEKNVLRNGKLVFAV